MMLDGEIAVPDERGVTHVDRLTEAIRVRRAESLAYFAFAPFVLDQDRPAFRTVAGWTITQFRQGQLRSMLANEPVELQATAPLEARAGQLPAVCRPTSRPSLREPSPILNCQ